ncbi:hypothetical protein K2P97_06740 [bacterium]|nr:hypothetical protein [bacterium]
MNSFQQLFLFLSVLLAINPSLYVSADEPTDLELMAAYAKPKAIKVIGYIRSKPIRAGDLIKEEQYSFEFSLTNGVKADDEYYLVSYHLLKHGKKVGKWTYKQGDQIAIEGVFRQNVDFEKRKIGQSDKGLIGYIDVNSGESLKLAP